MTLPSSSLLERSIRRTCRDLRQGSVISQRSGFDTLRGRLTTSSVPTLATSYATGLAHSTGACRCRLPSCDHRRADGRGCCVLGPEVAFLLARCVHSHAARSEEHRAPAPGGVGRPVGER